MATFTSVQCGDWNDGATWGNSSPGVKGTDWPGNAGDVANIGHSVCYNVSETNELGVTTIMSGGDLYFSGSMNTKLTLGHVDLVMGKYSTLNVGREGDIIPCSYTAEIWWNTTADNVKGIQAGSGTDGINFYGDGAYYGSSYIGFLVNTWQGGQTFTLSGDLYDRWITGQKVIVHKDPFVYGDWETDVVEFTISSIWDDSGNTSILISESAPGSDEVFNAGGQAVNVSRNVMLGKLNYGTGVASYNSNRPEMDVRETSSVTHFVADNAILAGFHHIECDTGVMIRKSVLRNNYYGLYHISRSHFDDTVFFGNYTGVYISQLCWLENPAFMGNYYPAYLSDFLEITSATIYSNVYGIRDAKDIDISGLVYNNSTAFRDIRYSKFSMLAYANFNLIYGCDENEFENGSFGYDKNGAYRKNEYDFYFAQHNNNYVKCSTVNTPMNFIYRNQVGMSGKTVFENFDETAGNFYVSHAFYDLTKETTVVRSGGADESLKVTPFTNIIDRKSYIIDCWHEYDLEANVEHDRYIYVMATGWDTVPRSGRLCLEVTYYDQSSGCHNATTVSTTILSANSVWEAIQVTFTPVQSRSADYKLYLKDYDSTSNRLFIDHQIRQEL